MIIITSTPKNFANAWCVYMLRDANTAKIEYIGYCPLLLLFSLSGARAKPGFDENQLLILQVGETYPDKAAARTGATRIINQGETPRLNRMARYSAVKCIDTGETWKNARQAAKAHGLSQPALSNHLNGKTGYKKVKGRRYVRVTHTPEPSHIAQ